MNTPLVAVVGPTATGKSGLGIQLARALGGEIVNADSMQLYRGMDIGTAKEPAAARQGVPHHLLDIWPVTQAANVADYQKLARAAIDDIGARDRVPVLVGGSGLYVRAALDDLHFPGTDTATRARLTDELALLGPASLHARLATLDPAAAAAILPGNGRRIVRALEVIELSGRPFTATMPSYAQVRPAVQIGLTLPRPELDLRIAARADRMWQAGFEAEVRALAAQGLREGPTASRALGYQQLLRHLDGECTLDDARAETIKATKRFARRQESWFRRDPRVRWLDATAPEEHLLADALRHVRLHLVGELVRAFGVVGAEHPGEPHHGPFGIKIFLDPGAQEVGERAPEQRRAQVIQLGQPERVGGVQELPVRRELERLGEQRGGAGAQVVGGQPRVDVHVREHLGQVAGLAMVGVVVQQHHRHPGRLDRPQQRGEQQRVAAVQVDVAVPVADVELNRQPQVHAAPDEEPLQGLVRDPRLAGRCSGGQPAVGRGGHLGVGGPVRAQVQAGTVGGDRLHPHTPHGPRCGGGAGGQRGTHRVSETAGADPGGHHIFGYPLEPDDLTGRSRPPGRRARPGRSAAPA